MTLVAPRRRARTRWAVLGLIVLTLGLTLGTSVFAASSTTPAYGKSGAIEGSVSLFEGGDGDRTSNTGFVDWADITANTTRIEYDVKEDKTAGSTDNSFGAGTKEDLTAATIVLGSVPPNKNDLTKLEIGSEFTAGSVFVYLGWTRFKNIGNANLDFEINQAAYIGFSDGTTGAVRLQRTVGDLLITYDFSGSGLPTLGLATWQVSGGWSLPMQIDSSTGQSGVGAGGLFGEAAIDLTKAGIFGSTCRQFSAGWVKSRSSSSFSAEVKDFIAPVGVHITNCGIPSFTPKTTLIPNLELKVEDLRFPSVSTGDNNRMLTISLFDDSCGTQLYTQSFEVTSNTTYVTTNQGEGAGGYTIRTADDTYKWKAVYRGDSQNDPATLDCGFQVIDITTPTP